MSENKANYEVPSQMKGIVIEETGGVDKLLWRENLPVPKLGDGEVLVKNDYIGVNYIDTYFRSGLYPPKLPLILGQEGAGTVVASKGAEFKPGDRVCFMSNQAYAEYTAASSDEVFRLPDSIDTKTGAASLLQGLTALAFIRETPVQPSSTVLVLAAAGGVGQWMVQILKAIGCTVIAAAGSDAKVELAKGLGADFSVNYTTQSLTEAVAEICKTQHKTAFGGPDVILDGVGASTFDADLEMIARKGTVVVFGNASGAVPPINALKLAPKCIKLIRPMLFGYMATREEKEKYVTEMFGLLDGGQVKVGVHDVYPLKDVARAHTDLSGRKTTGKLLLKL